MSQEPPRYPPPPQADYPQPGYIPPPPGYAPPPPGYAPPGYAPQQVGYAPVGSPYIAAPVTSKWAIASLVCSLVGLCVGFSAILGVIFGHMALSEIKKSNNYIQGRGLALAGLIIGYVEIGLGVLFVVFVVIAASLPPTQ